MMPPMYVNVGAYVDDGTMIDSHALVGSCAQVGKMFTSVLLRNLEVFSNQLVQIR